MPRPQLAIDFVADVICPWCYIGWVRLGQALQQRPQLQATVRWAPFQLHPETPREGADQRTTMRTRYPDGDRRRAMGAALRGEAAEAGVTLNMEAIARTPNTLDAHRLIRWAGQADRQDAVVEGLFRAYFEQGGDIGARETLADIGQAAGLARDATLRRLDARDDVEAVGAEAESAAHLGVGVVPFIRLDGEVAVIGARPLETMLKALDRRQAVAATD